RVRGVDVDHERERPEMGAGYSDPVRSGPRQLQRVQQGEDQDDRRRLRRLWRWSRAHPQDARAHAWTPGPAAPAEEVRHGHPLRRSLPPAGQPQVPPHPDVQLLARRDAGLDRPDREDRQEQEGALRRAARPERFRRASEVPRLSRVSLMKYSSRDTQMQETLALLKILALGNR